MIVVLIAIALPALGRARESAKRAQCLSNQKQLGELAFIFMNEEGYRLPMLMDSARAFEQNVLRCPSDPAYDLAPPSMTGGEEPMEFSYAFNFEYGLFGMQYEDVHGPSDKVYLYDGLLGASVSGGAVASAGGNGGIVALAGNGNGNGNGNGGGGGSTSAPTPSDNTDSVLYYIDGKFIRIVHVPPGNPSNAKATTINVNGLHGHSNHGGDFIGDIDGPFSLRQRLNNAFVARHMGEREGNALFADGHAQSILQLEDRMFNYPDHVFEIKGDGGNGDDEDGGGGNPGGGGGKPKKT